MLGGTNSVIKTGNQRGRERLKRFGTSFGFPGGLSRPFVGLQKACDIGSGMHLDETARLKDVNAIEFSGEAKLGERGRGFIGELETTANDIIDLWARSG